MRNQTKSWTGLLALCLLLMGCGSEEPASDRGTPAQETAPPPMQTEMIVEPSEPTLFIDSKAQPSVEIVRVLLTNGAARYPAMADIEIDKTFESTTQVKFLVKVGDAAVAIDDETAKTLADQTVDALKEAFNAIATKALIDELAFYRSKAESLAEEVRVSQAALQTFQETRRGLPQTDASRLERRTLERQIELALQEQIEANKMIEKLQKRIAQDRHATLLRVR